MLHLPFRSIIPLIHSHFMLKPSNVLKISLEGAGNFLISKCLVIPAV